MTEILKIKSAHGPLTLAGVPDGFLPSLMADLSRAADTRAVLIAADDAAMWPLPMLRYGSHPK